MIVKDIFKSTLKKLELENNKFSKSSNISTVNIVKNINGYYLPNEFIPPSYIVSASFRKGQEPTQVLPLPKFNKIEDVNIIALDNELQININHQLETNDIYQPIFGERIYLISYEDENKLENYLTSSSSISIPFNKNNFTITIKETYKNNTKICGDSYMFNYTSPHTNPILF